MNLRPSCAHPAPVFETIPAPGPWIGRAACANEPTDLFFPEDGEGTELAKAICGGCPVRAECIGYAVAIPSLDGIWGGLTRQERFRLRQSRNCRRAATNGACPADVPTQPRTQACRTSVSGHSR
jgi:WhiB family transcriptional regulator, redox-sensing transcriptional regulator